VLPAGQQITAVLLPATRHSGPNRSFRKIGVQGYFPLIINHSRDFEPAVTTVGTALATRTPEQMLKLLKPS
jgi:hypothetical protein